MSSCRPKDISQSKGGVLPEHSRHQSCGSRRRHRTSLKWPQICRASAKPFVVRPATARDSSRALRTYPPKKPLPVPAPLQHSASGSGKCHHTLCSELFFRRAIRTNDRPVHICIGRRWYSSRLPASFRNRDLSGRETMLVRGEEIVKPYKLSASTKWTSFDNQRGSIYSCHTGTRVRYLNQNPMAGRIFGGHSNSKHFRPARHCR